MGLEDHFNKFLKRCVMNALEQAGIENSVAQTIADQIDQEIRHQYGGDRHYIHAVDKQRRNQQIIQAWKSGQSRAEIAKRIGAGTSTVSRVINSHLSEQTNLHTGFGTEEWNL